MKSLILFADNVPKKKFAITEKDKIIKLLYVATGMYYQSYQDVEQARLEKATLCQTNLGYYSKINKVAVHAKNPFQLVSNICFIRKNIICSLNKYDIINNLYSIPHGCIIKCVPVDELHAF